MNVISVNECQGVKTNGELIRQRRHDLTWSQEQLAQNSGVALRTIQRAERSESISVETAASIAAALGLPARQLAAPDAAVEPDEPDVVVLKRMDAARELVEGLVKADRHIIECDVEPSEDTVEQLIDLVRNLESLDPHPEHPADFALGTLSARLKFTAALNRRLAELGNAGISVYYGEYVSMGKRLRWDNEERCWYIRTTQAEEPLTTAVVQISTSPLPRLIKRVADKAPEEAPPSESDNVPW